jgi:hypothetical protein
MDSVQNCGSCMPSTLSLWLRYAYASVVGNAGGWALGAAWQSVRCADIIKVNLKQVVWGPDSVVSRLEIWRVLANTMMNLWVLQKGNHFWYMKRESTGVQGHSACSHTAHIEV